jgi:ABC-2 type transport system ATP-binding protein
VVDHGRVIARGDARSLKRQIGGDQLRVVVADRDDLAEVTAIVARIAGVAPTVDAGARTVVAPAIDARGNGSGDAGARAGVTAIGALADALADADVAVEDLGLTQPTLDDVFLTLTGAPPESEDVHDGAVPVTTISEEHR